jgi:hypothetical protein
MMIIITIWKQNHERDCWELVAYEKRINKWSGGFYRHNFNTLGKWKWVWFGGEGSDLLHFCEHFFKGYFKVYYYGQRAELPLRIKERGREIHSNIGDPIELYSCMIYDYFKFSRIFISTKSIIKSWIH